MDAEALFAELKKVDQQKGVVIVDKSGTVLKASGTFEGGDQVRLTIYG